MSKQDDYLMEILKQNDFKITPARVSILKILSEDQRAFSQVEIQNTLSDWSIQSDKATVYRTLNSFVEKKLVHKVPSDENQWLFSYGVGSDESHADHKHVHFKCDSCAQTYCLEAEEISTTIKLEPKYEKTFTLNSTEILVHGFCPQCHD